MSIGGGRCGRCDRCVLSPVSGVLRYMTPTDAEIVHQVRQGNIGAFGVLVNRHSPRLVRYALRLLGDRADAEEAVQEALVRAFSSPATKNASSSAPGSSASSSIGAALPPRAAATSSRSMRPRRSGTRGKIRSRLSPCARNWAVH